MTKEEKQGMEGEEKFINWLDEQEIPYLAIQQKRSEGESLNKFSKVIKECDGKRPDFNIYCEQIGIVYIDVKNYKTNYYHIKNCEKFQINQTEVDKTSIFDKIYGTTTWFAFNKYNHENDDNWYFIQASFIKKKNNWLHDDVYYIPINSPRIVQTKDDLIHHLSNRYNMRSIKETVKSLLDKKRITS